MCSLFLNRLKEKPFRRVLPFVFRECVHDISCPATYCLTNVVHTVGHVSRKPMEVLECGATWEAPRVLRLTHGCTR